MGAQGARRENNGVMRFVEHLQRDVPAHVLSAENVHTGQPHLLDLPPHDIAGQPERRNTQDEEATGLLVPLVHDHAVSPQGEFPGDREPRRAATHHRHRLPRPGKHGVQFHRFTRGEEIGARALGEADGHRFAEPFPPVPANRLAGAGAHAAEYGGKHVVPQIDAIGLRIVAAGNGAQVAGDIRLRGTGGLAGNVLLQPVEVLGSGSKTP